MLLHIDGTEDDNWVSGSRVPPFAIFDEDAQTNLRVNIRWYWLAVLWRCWYRLNGTQG